MSGNYPAGVTDNHAEFDMPSMPQTVRIPCQHCGGEGSIEHGHPNAPYPDWVEFCPVCEGAQFEEVDAEPLTEGDLDEAFAAPPEDDGQPTEAQEWADFDREC